jgi:hypothetical protein
MGPSAVLEIQASGISIEEVREREEFYGEMAWMLKGQDFAERLSYRYKGNGRYALTWKAPRKTWAASKRRLLVDLDGEVVELMKISDPDSTPWVIEARFLSAEDIYELVLGRGWGVPECGREWCENFSQLHLKRKRYEQALDGMRVFIKKWWMYTYRERMAFLDYKEIASLPLWTEIPNVYEDLRLQRQVWSSVDQCHEKIKFWLQLLDEFSIFLDKLNKRNAERLKAWEIKEKERAKQCEKEEAERIARDLAYRREQEEAARISAEKAKQLALARRKQMELEATIVVATKRSMELLRQASIFAREVNRGDLCDEIIALRPVPVKVLGSFSTGELSELLQSFVAAKDRLGENEWKRVVETYRA